MLRLYVTVVIATILHKNTKLIDSIVLYQRYHLLDVYLKMFEDICMYGKIQ